MRWFCAHLIFSFDFIDPSKQVDHPVWENLVLVSAESPERAIEKAEAFGREDASFVDDTLTCDGEPARMHFRGVRKVVECDPPVAPTGNGLAERTEVSYNRLILATQEDVARLARGEPVQAELQD